MSNLLVNNLSVYLNSSNRSSLQLLECDAPLNLGSVTKIKIESPDIPSLDSDNYPLAFDWKSGPIGVILFSLGKYQIDLSAGVYNTNLFIYDVLNYHGAWFGSLRLFVYDRP